MIFHNLTETNQSYDICNVRYYSLSTTQVFQQDSCIFFYLPTSNCFLGSMGLAVSFSPNMHVSDNILQIFLRGKMTLFFPCTTSIPQEYWWCLNSCPFNWFLTCLMPFISLLEAILLIFTLDRLVLNGTRRFSWVFIEKPKPSLLLSLKRKKYQSVDPSNPQGNAA